MMRSLRIGIMLLLAPCVSYAAAAPLPLFEFTKPEVAREWQPTHDVASLTPTAQGLVIRINGNDPYIHGPARDYPRDLPLWLTIRFRSDQAGDGQIFYFRRGATEENSVHFPARGGGIWEIARVPVPALGPGYHLRLDPPGTGGSCMVACIRFAPRLILPEPSWPQPKLPVLGGHPYSVRSGPVRLVQNRSQLGGFVLEVGGKRMAVGYTEPRIGYLLHDHLRWLNLGAAGHVHVAWSRAGIRVSVTARDMDGAVWNLDQRISPSRRAGAINVDVTATPDRVRSVVFLPMLVILPGAGTFGGQKNQGLFPGLEYLGDEPSSSEADVTGPPHRRQVPDTLKITFPLMTIQAEHRYVGLIWQTNPDLSAWFDSPDRTLKAGGHLMGILFPGSDGKNRVEGNLLPYDGVPLSRARPAHLHATLIGGEGESVVPGVKQYVALHPLPGLPSPILNRQQYVATAAAGWLRSGVHVGSEYRHAIPGGFEPHPTADAAVLMLWLSRQMPNRSIAAQLKAAALAAIARVDPPDYNFAAVSHVTYPVEDLVFGHVAEGARRARQAGRDLLRQFAPGGVVLYHAPPAGNDLARTSHSRTSNGLTAQVVASLLQQAAVSGDPDLKREALGRLRALDQFRNSVPRGAQTWEVPLHTPDILASAHLVRAYTLGYELTGDRALLEEAKSWAWTGVPFVYLRAPVSGPVGPYATPPVFGATEFVAPVWMGLPVQWCGLVYADSLYRLSRFDPSGPWRRLAEGITASGVQQTWPAGSDAERQGLLPDSFNLRPQLRNNPAINPGTVQTNAIRLYGGPELYDFHSFVNTGLLVHAPGAISDAYEEGRRVSFQVNSWTGQPYYVLVAGFAAAPVAVTVRPPAAAQEFVPDGGWLVLRLSGPCTVAITVKR